MIALHQLSQEEKDRVLMAIHRLKRNNDFKEFISLLEFSLAQADLILREAEEHQLYRQQGKSQAISDVLTVIQESSDYVRVRQAGME